VAVSKREELDALCWRTIKSAKVLPYEGSKYRPNNYAEISAGLRAGGEFELLWGDFLHAFYLYRHPSFFEFPSPEELSLENQALLAGAADWLSAEFGLPHPAWTDNPRYFLHKTWDPWEDLGLDMSEFFEAKLQRSPEAFRKRNIAFESRNLIVL
jgi:hypothetical protein